MGVNSLYINMIWENPISFYFEMKLIIIIMNIITIIIIIIIIIINKTLNVSLEIQALVQFK